MFKEYLEYVMAASEAVMHFCFSFMGHGEALDGALLALTFGLLSFVMAAMLTAPFLLAAMPIAVIAALLQKRSS